MGEDTLLARRKLWAREPAPCRVARGHLQRTLQITYEVNKTRRSEKQDYAAILLRARPRETPKSAEI